MAEARKKEKRRRKGEREGREKKGERPKAEGNPIRQPTQTTPCLYFGSTR